MAEEIDYKVPPTQLPGAHEELEELLEILHKGGTLRALRGLFGKLGQVSEIGIDQINTPSGRNLIALGAILMNFLGQLPTEKLKPLYSGVENGVQRARKCLEEDPPSTLNLMSLLHDRDTRRTLGAALEFLRTVGEALGKDSEDGEEQ